MKKLQTLIDISNRSERIDARLSKEELETFHKEAEQLGMTKSTFVRFLLKFYLENKNAKTISNRIDR